VLTVGDDAATAIAATAKLLTSITARILMVRFIGASLGVLPGLIPGRPAKLRPGSRRARSKRPDRFVVKQPIHEALLFCPLRERECGRIGPMSDPRTAAYGSVRWSEVDTLEQVDPGNADINDCDFHLVRRHFDVRALGVNVATGNAGDEMIEEHHEADDEENQTNGHEELYAVMTGHAVFTVDGEEIDARAGTIVFVRDPALLRAARATADNTAIFMVGGPVGIPYAVSRWEVALP
jgi:hypothetical protein